MTAQELENLGVCGTGSALGFNTENGCADIIKAAYAIWLISPSVTIAADQEVDLTYIKSLQKAGQLVVIKGVNTFEENGSDDAFETLDDDTKILTNKGKYNFMATFTHGMYFQRALGSIEGFGNWRTAYVDNAGKVVLTKLENGSYRGFRTGQITPKKLTMPSNSASLKQGLEFQLLDRFEMDDNPVVWDKGNLGFDPRLVEPITQVYLSLTAVPANADTELSVKATFDRGRKDAFSGALFGQFNNKINGADSNPTAGDDSATAGTYVLTVPALATGQNGAIKLYDVANNTDVVEVDGELYKSNTETYSVS